MVNKCQQTQQDTSEINIQKGNDINLFVGWLNGKSRVDNKISYAKKGSGDHFSVSKKINNCKRDATQQKAKAILTES